MVSAHAKATHDEIETTIIMSIRDIGRPRLAKGAPAPRDAGIDAGAVSLGGLTRTSGAKQSQFKQILNKYQTNVTFNFIYLVI